MIRSIGMWLCRHGWHRFDRRRLDGYVEETSLRPGVTERRPFVRCSRCREYVNTTVDVPRRPARFPLEGWQR